jgi:fibronectin-binding autotransporter adhesin
MCSAWSGDSSDQAITGNNQVTVTLSDGGASSDSVTVSSTQCTFNFGSINLGSTGYLTGGGTRTYSGSSTSKSTIEWDASSRTLTITIGNNGSGGTIGTVASSSATYNPSSAITDSAGNGSIASKSTGTAQQF